MSKEAWQKFLNGDQSSFSELYFTYFNELLFYGKGMGFDEDTCKDAIQDLFFKIYVSGKKLNHIRHIEFYLLQSLKNNLFDQYNRETALLHIELKETEATDNENIIDQLIREENRNKQTNEILQLLTTLRPKQRKIIRYRYLLNLDNREIAALMHTSPEAIKKSIYRALRKMKQNSSRK